MSEQYFVVWVLQLFYVADEGHLKFQMLNYFPKQLFPFSSPSESYFRTSESETFEIYNVTQHFKTNQKVNWFFWGTRMPISKSDIISPKTIVRTIIKKYTLNYWLYQLSTHTIAVWPNCNIYYFSIVTVKSYHKFGNLTENFTWVL